jgi:hypothetical protein
MRKTIQIGNLDTTIDCRKLTKLFMPYGIVRVATVSAQADTGQSTGVGLVEMESEGDGELAIAELNGRIQNGRVLSVCWSNACSDRDGMPQVTFGPMNLADVQAPRVDEPEQRELTRD